MGKLHTLKQTIDNTEAVLVDLVAAIVPWFAPLIPAYMAYHNMVDVLGFGQWIAFAGAAVIELLGLATVHTVFWLWDYNDTARKSDVKNHGKAPVLVAIGMSGFYLLIVVLVNVLLDLQAPIEQIAAKMLLSLISIPAAVTVAIRSQHKRRLGEIEAQQDAKRAERLQAAGAKMKSELQATQAELQQVQSERKALQEKISSMQVASGKLQDELRRLQAQPRIPQAVGPYGLDLLQVLDGKLQAADVAAKHGISESTVSRDKSKLNGGVL